MPLVQPLIDSSNNSLHFPSFDTLTLENLAWFRLMHQILPSRVFSNSPTMMAHSTLSLSTHGRCPLRKSTTRFTTKSYSLSSKHFATCEHGYLALHTLFWSSQTTVISLILCHLRSSIAAKHAGQCFCLISIFDSPGHQVMQTLLMHPPDAQISYPRRGMRPYWV
ncbi:hypothetical protein K503DRAFT_820076, partial [Rhizopogon vinicolor AM-OR11-026]